MRNISFLTLILVSTSLLSNPYHHAEASHGLLSQEFGNRLLRRYGGNLGGDGLFNKRYPGLQERAEEKKFKKFNNKTKNLKALEDIEEDPKGNNKKPKGDKEPELALPKGVKKPDAEPLPPKEVKEPNDKEVKKPVKKPKNGQIKEVKAKPEIQEKQNKDDVVKNKDNDEPADQFGTPQVKTGDMSGSAVIGLVCVGTVFAAVTGLFAFVRKKKNKEMTKNIVSTSASAWEQQQNSTFETMEEVEDVEAKPIGSYTVVATYTPALADELDIQPGDKVSILVEYDDGWVQGINETRGGAKGVFPRHCVDMNTALNDKRSSSIGGYTIVDLN